MVNSEARGIKVMLHEKIRNNDFKRNTALFRVVTTLFQHCIAVANRLVMSPKNKRNHLEALAIGAREKFCWGG